MRAWINIAHVYGTLKPCPETNRVATDSVDYMRKTNGGIYFGTTDDQVYTSADAGDS
jgi:hypothetical protein